MVNLLTFERNHALHLRQQMLDSRLSPVVVNLDWCTDVVWSLGEKVPAVVAEEDGEGDDNEVDDEDEDEDDEDNNKEED
ncbi:hypothetical protein G6F70_008528 [Rhizopus microsporus]|uniref:Uncharacterized protein n=1 Tax=Rhizopus azygosporus TaxID=86630 RepID=A0A367JBH7_RHIAZ|nr:hypothetical protein G6F71_008647 [Rhizopus microsporus]RCH87081.1 hypothetical protein CU097_004715 [Rhizopus azygosporus]KAG1195054.1 hypothetical protein G6F70_008528 [Rhizopus microsporus]KAG1206900.1 hypothetical protein G6F69_008479 [Rhizopus microsporus]KAG1227553.1 hypothetical protein G6F67_008382 [Rhizopus microsporus]